MTVPNTLTRAGTVFHDSHDHPTEHLTFAAGPGPVQQHRHHPGRREAPAGRPCTATCASSASARSRGIGFPGESPGLRRQALGLERVAALHDDVRPGPVAQRHPGRRGVPDHRQRRRAHAAQPRRRQRGPRRQLHRRPRRPRGCAWSRPAVAKQVREMLEGVVGKEGTAPEAKIPGYRVAGKTGTADRYDDTTRPLLAARRPRSSASPPPTSPELVVGGDPAATGQGLLRRRRSQARCSTTS